MLAYLKGNEERKNITDISWGNKEEKYGNENENPIIPAFLIRREATIICNCLRRGSRIIS